MRNRLAIAIAALALATLVPKRAQATEHQVFVGGTVAYGYIDEHTSWFSGIGGVGEFRYGLNDELDLQLDVSAFEYPTGSQIVPGTSAGLVYVLDITRFVPQIGATFGIDDIVTYQCPEGARPCGHDLYPALTIPGSFDFRLTPHVSVGAHFRYTFLFVGEASSQISIGGALAFSTAP